MSKEELFEAYIAIDNAIEISFATLSVISDQTEDERLSWALMGVMEQIEKIQKTIELLNEATSRKAVEA